MKRILGLILISTMLMTMILPASAATNAIPDVGTSIYSSNFSSDYLEIVRKAVVSDNKLVLTEEGEFQGAETEDTHRAEVKVYPAGNSGKITDNVVVDFTWKKSTADDAIQAYLYGSTGQVVRVLSYKADSGFYVGRTVAGELAGETGDYDFKSGFDMETNTIRVTLSLDFAEDCFDLWINGQFAKTYTGMAMDDLSYIKFDTYGHKSRSSNIEMTNIKVYTPAEDPAVALESVTRDALTVVPGDDATFLGDKLNLDFSGITFTSSDSTVIDPVTGVVTRPQQTKNVMLTATAGSATKDFAFRIPGLFDNVPVESVVYYDDFEDGILDSRIEKAQYSQTNLEANGALNLKSTGSGGDLGSDSHSTGIVHFKNDQTAVDGRFKVEFELKRQYAYGKTRVFFTGPNGYSHYIDWMPSSYNSDGDVWTTQIRLTTFGASNDDVLNTNAYKYVGTLKVEALFDNSNNGSLEELIINGDKFNLNYCGQPSADRKVSRISISEYHTDADVLMNYLSISQLKEASPEKVIYADDFEDGVQDSRIVAAAYSQNPMEANGYLNFKSTGSGGDLGDDSHSTGIVHFKNDQTAVDGRFKVEFELKRDKWVYGKTRIYFSGPDGYCYYIDWCGSSTPDYRNWSTQIRLTTFGASNDDVLNTSLYNYVSTLKVEALIDNDAGTMELTLNGDKFNMTYGGQLPAGRKVSRISISEYHTSADIMMNYLSCTQALVKETVTETTLDYNAFDKKVTVVSPEAKSATVIAAAYSGTENNATLVSVVPVPTTLVEDGSVTVDAGALNVNGASFVKLYLWDSVAGLKPLAAPACVSDIKSN